MKRPRRSTPAGEHRPVLLEPILEIFAPQPGQTVVDCTVGWAGHAVPLLEKVGPTGILIGIDLDADNLPQARERLARVGHPFHLVHGNFAGLPTTLGGLGVEKVDFILADLGMSSMQVDDPQRGFSYRRTGALDMRMDRSRGRTAARLLQTIAEKELAQALRELGDEPLAEIIASAIVQQSGQLATTTDLVALIEKATGQENWRLHPAPGRWQLHPAARTFQALRILVNRELGNLSNLLRVFPESLNSGGKIGIISFHSGEDRLVKHALRSCRDTGALNAISSEAVRASYQERGDNPRARSAKFRWGQKT